MDCVRQFGGALRNGKRIALGRVVARQRISMFARGLALFLQQSIYDFTKGGRYTKCHETIDTNCLYPTIRKRQSEESFLWRPFILPIAAFLHLQNTT